MASTATSTTAKRSATDDGSTRPRKIRSSAAEAPKTGTRTIAVHVGKGHTKQTFDVYELSLVTHSEFFRAAASERWKEGQERTVSLPDDKPEYFEIFFNFLNGGQIFSSKADDYIKEKNTDAEWARLLLCWVFGQKILSVTFKDAIVDAMVEKTKDGPHCTNLYTTPFDQSTPSKQLRKLLADIVVYRFVPVDWKTATTQITKYPEHLLDVALALDGVKIQGRAAMPPWANNDCTYHEHVADGTPCYKTLF
ncbi:hypothetical protein LTR27_012066 [Elasticomyces elasticus]|nr:hypothetical protein LTR27_012066 [Elasticomyces elasticus]